MAHVIRSKLLGTRIKDVHRSILKRETSASNLCSESLQIVEETQNLNPFITICRDEAITRAKQLDQRFDGSSQDSISPLFGVPISIKDNFCTNQLLTTCGSKMLHNFIPPYTATAVSKLLDANSIMIGKTNLDEFAMGSSCTTSYYGPTANSWKCDKLGANKPTLSSSSNWYMAGGSSTGSAVSVASGACFASLATDTGGSTRQPASLTGVIGFKPTYGLVSRFGLIPLVHCLDVVSILARHIDDVEIVFNTIVGQDENDLTTVDYKTELKSYLRLPEDAQSNGKTRIRVGVPRKFISRLGIANDIAKRLEEVIKSLSNNENVEFQLKNLDLVNSRYASECYTIISSAEIASNMSCYDGVKYGYSCKLNASEKFDRDEYFKRNRDEAFGPEVKKRILLGNHFLMSGNRELYLDQALRLRRLISDEFDKVFERNQVDIVLMPSTPTTSVSYKEWSMKQDDNLLFREDYFLIPANLANLPSISLPSGLSSNGLPIGLQLIGKRFHDLDLLRVSKYLESNILTEFNA